MKRFLEKRSLAHGMFVSFFFLFSFFVAPLAFAQEAPVLEIPIPGLEFSEITIAPGEQVNIPWIAEYLNALYRFSIIAAAVASTVVIMIGGLLWLTAAGNQATIGRAKEYIIGALMGLIISLGSYFILAQINPRLVDFNNIKIQTVGATCGSFDVTSAAQEQCAEMSPALTMFLLCFGNALRTSGMSEDKVTITSISAGGDVSSIEKTGYDNCRYNYKDSSCKTGHRPDSCHFGGPPDSICSDGSYAVDISATKQSDDNKTGNDKKLAQIAIDNCKDKGTFRLNSIYGPNGKWSNEEPDVKKPYPARAYDTTIDKDKKMQDDHQTHLHISVNPPSGTCKCDSVQ